MDLEQKILEIDKYKLALSEVDAIIESSNITEQEKIPLKFREFIKNKKNKDYIYIVDKNKQLSEQNIMRETKIIFSLIYRSYFCSEEEKKFLKQKDIEEKERKEIELREKYNPDNLFKKADIVKDEIKVEEENTNNKLTVVKKENVFKRIINKIKNIFQKNK